MDDGSCAPLDLCTTLLAFASKWASTRQGLRRPDYIHEQPFELMPLILSKITCALDEELKYRSQAFEEDRRRKAMRCHLILHSLISHNSEKVPWEELDDLLWRIMHFPTSVPHSIANTAPVDLSQSPFGRLPHMGAALVNPALLLPRPKTTRESSGTAVDPSMPDEKSTAGLASVTVLPVAHPSVSLHHQSSNVLLSSYASPSFPLSSGIHAAVGDPRPAVAPASSSATVSTSVDLHTHVAVAPTFTSNYTSSPTPMLMNIEPTSPVVVSPAPLSEQAAFERPVDKLQFSRGHSPSA